jgi:hypothetical protein
MPAFEARRMLVAAVRPIDRLETVAVAAAFGRVASTFRGSSAISSLGGVEAFAILPTGRATVRSGSRLRVFVLDPPLGPFGSV